ncbi:MAG: hypothetical protein KJ697_03980 [Nanoarchaeota archaeon]|nr:hypothetical protein [Nanoarchaeota archaeon]
MKTQSESNYQLLRETTENITRYSINDTDKAYRIYEWFQYSGNMTNIYGKNTVLPGLIIRSEDPHICIPLNENKYVLWVLTGKCGACLEYSLLYREIANESNLTVRSVHNYGEDHNWDEVLIDNKWIIVDPSMYWFNVSPFDEETRRGPNGLNMSYVFAEYSNGTQEDITYRYTNTSNITIKILNKNRGNISIKVLSNNLLHVNNRTEVDTNLSCKTDMNGICTLTLGGGNYTLSLEKNMFFPQKEYIAIDENKEYEKEYLLK